MGTRKQALLLVTAFCLSPATQAEINYYQPHNPKACKAPNKSTTPQESQHTVEEAYKPRLKYNQGNFGNCYFFSALYSLQYLVNQTSGTSEKNLAILDVLSKGCNQTLREGGTTAEVWQTLRTKNHKEAYLEPFVADYSQMIESLSELETYEGKSNCQECCDLFRNRILNPELLHFFKDNSHIMEALIPESEKKPDPHFPLTVVDRLASKLSPHLAKSPLPDFNIYIKESTHPNGDKKTQTEALDEIKKHFSTQPVYPINLSFCPSSETKNQTKFCPESHVVAVTGVRDACCETPEGKKTCHSEFQIANSYGGHQEGWFRADGNRGLLESFLNFRGDYAILRPCHSGEHKAQTTQGPQLEACDPNIQGDKPTFHYHVMTKDTEGAVRIFKEGKILHPLTWSLADDNAILTQKLLENGANPNEPNSNGLSPLAQAIRRKQTHIAELLIQFGADVNAVDSKGKSVLMKSVESGNAPLTRLLLKKGAQLQQTGQLSLTPLQTAFYRGDIFTLHALIENGANIDEIDQTGSTLLINIIKTHFNDVESHRFDVVVLLGASVEKKDKDGVPPLIHAVTSQNPTLLERLLDNSANVNTTDSNGRTALMQAVGLRNLDKGASSHLIQNRMIRTLLKAHARIDLRDNSGMNALDIANKNGRQDLVRLIKTFH